MTTRENTETASPTGSGHSRHIKASETMLSSFSPWRECAWRREQHPGNPTEKKMTIMWYYVVCGDWEGGDLCKEYKFEMTNNKNKY